MYFWKGIQAAIQFTYRKRLQVDLGINKIYRFILRLGRKLLRVSSRPRTGMTNKRSYHTSVDFSVRECCHFMKLQYEQNKNRRATDEYNQAKALWHQLDIDPLTMQNQPVIKNTRRDYVLSDFLPPSAPHYWADKVDVEYTSVLKYCESDASSPVRSIGA